MIGRRTVVGGIGASLIAGPGPAQTRRAFTNSIALDSGRVWMAVKIGEAGPFYFAVDTGAEYSMMDHRLAARLKLRPEGVVQMSGVGGTQASAWYRAPDLRLASGLRFPNVPFAGIDAGSSIGGDAAGLLGCGLFTTYDSDLDFARGQWRVYPDARGSFAGLQRLPSRFLKVTGGRQIVADVDVDGFVASGIVDTGAPGELLLGAGATKRSGLWRDDQPYAPVRSGGVGPRSVRGRAIRLKRLKLGPFVFEQPIVVLNRGTGASLDTDGLIGLATLARLHLTADVKGQALWAAPNGLAPPRGSYIKTGLWLERRGDGWVVDEVGLGSPAAAAGLTGGDQLIDMSPAQIERLLAIKIGAPETLTVERDGRRRTVTVTPADYL